MDQLPDRIKQALDAVRALGQPSYVSAEALFHLINGQVTGWLPHTVRYQGQQHWFLRHQATGIVLDPTAQAPDQLPDYDHSRPADFLTGPDRVGAPAQKLMDQVQGIQKSEISEDPLVKAGEFQQAGFRHQATGQLYGTGPFHDIYQLPGAPKDTEDWDPQGYEAGFLDHHGKFYTRTEAAEHIGIKKKGDAGKLESTQYFQGAADPTVGAFREKWSVAPALETRKSELQKKISDLSPGTQLAQHPDTGESLHDYSHLLSPLQRSQYRMLLRTQPRTKTLSVHVEHLGGKKGDLILTPAPAEAVGVWNGSWEQDPKKKTLAVRNHVLEVDPQHRKRGLGLAMYEAALTHAKHIMGASELRGDYHSTAAAKVHEKLARKHGLPYRAVPAYGPRELYPDRASWSDPAVVDDNDGRFRPYKTVIKSEIHAEQPRCVSVLVESWDGKILWGRRQKDQKWTLPGGHLESGEEPAAGAVRELAEETSLSPKVLYAIGQANGESGVQIYAFKALCRGTPTGQQDPDREFSEFRWVDCSQGVPAEISQNLAYPKNVVMRLMGWQNDPKPDMISQPKEAPSAESNR